MDEPSICMPHMLRGYANDLRTEAHRSGTDAERARLLRESADLIEIAASRDEAKTNDSGVTTWE